MSYSNVIGCDTNFMSGDKTRWDNLSFQKKALYLHETWRYSIGTPKIVDALAAIAVFDIKNQYSYE